MLIGAVALSLKVTRGGTLLLNHGRLLHAAFLNLVREADEKLSYQLHESNQKSFAVDLIRRQQSVRCPRWTDLTDATHFRLGEIVTWRLTGLVDRVTEFLHRIPLNIFLRVGQLEFEVVGKTSLQDDFNDCGMVTMGQLAKSCAALPGMNSITLEFVSPCSFKSFAKDYPFPRPELVFGSVVDKWNQYTDVINFDVNEIRNMANEMIIPDQWQGKTIGLKIDEHRAVKAFVGSFTFNLRQLDEETAKLFILLGEYARFSGIGRLTGQGFGRVKISYK